MILVTGATGLIGSHLLYKLVSDNNNVIALKRKNSSLDNVKRTFGYYSTDVEKLFTKIIWREGDILNFEEVDTVFKDITKVYHCAAIVSFNPKEKKKIIKNNVEGTANIVDACIKNNIKKLCHVSSIASLGGKKNEIIDESAQYDLNALKSAYSESKYRSELEVWRGIEEGLNAVIVNPAVVVGPGNWKTGSSSIFYNIWKGLNFYTEGITGYVDVMDVVNIMQQLMESDIKNERFVLNSQNINYKDFLSEIAKSLNCRIPQYKASDLLLNIAWRIDKIKSFIPGQKHLITKEIAKSASEICNYSNDKIKTTLNYNFIPVFESIKRTSEFFRNDFNIQN